MFQRWRHTLGYGVHSPLAFRLIKECVRTDGNYAYYADSRIDSIFSGDDGLCRTLHMLIRLFDVLHVSSLWMPDCPVKVRKFLSEEFPGMSFHVHGKMSENADFIVIFGKEDPLRCWNHINNDANLGMLVCRPCPGDGMRHVTLSLLSRSFSIFIRRDGMQHVGYRIL